MGHKEKSERREKGFGGQREKVRRVFGTKTRTVIKPAKKLPL